MTRLLDVGSRVYQLSGRAIGARDGDQTIVIGVKPRKAGAVLRQMTSIQPWVRRFACVAALACFAAACSGGEGRPAPASLAQGGAAGTDVGAGAAAGSTGGATGLGGNGGVGGVAAAFEPWKSNPAWGSDKCPPVPAGAVEGTLVGNYLATVTVKDCDGSDVSLDHFCGASALWIFAAHGWCPHCKLTSSLAEKIHADYEADGLASVVILVENAQGQPPTQGDCKAWRASYGLDHVAALYDPKGVTFQLYEQNYTALNVFVDENRIIAAKMHTDSESSIRSTIESLLK